MQDEAETWLGPNSIFKISQKLPSAVKPLKDGLVLQWVADSKWIYRRMLVSSSSIFVMHNEEDRWFLIKGSAHERWEDSSIDIASGKWRFWTEQFYSSNGV